MKQYLVKAKSGYGLTRIANRLSYRMPSLVLLPCLLLRVTVFTTGRLDPYALALWSPTQTRATYGGLCGMPGQAVVDTPELWRKPPRACVRVCAGAAESLHAYIQTAFSSRLSCTNQSSLPVPPPTCIAHTITIAIPLHDSRAIHDPPPTPLLYAVHHTILVMTILFDLYKIFVHSEAVAHKSPPLALPPPTCIAHPGAIRLHDYWTVYDSPSELPFVCYIPYTNGNTSIL